VRRWHFGMSSDGFSDNLALYETCGVLWLGLGWWAGVWALVWSLISPYGITLYQLFKAWAWGLKWVVWLSASHGDAAYDVRGRVQRFGVNYTEPAVF
jgi:hypothetical protein